MRVLLEGAWRLARDSKLQALGRHAQQRRGGVAMAAVAAHRTKLAAALAFEPPGAARVDGSEAAGATVGAS